MMMAADVTSLLRMMGRCNEKDVEVGGEAKRSDIVTMDLLGGCGGAVVGSKELDLDVQVPLGWEKRLDLTSGEVFLERNLNGRSNPDHRRREEPNSAPVPISVSFTAPTLDLNLFFPAPLSATQSTEYQSVCTLDKIKFALERIKKPHFSKRNPNPSSPTSSSTTTSSIREKHRRDRNDEESVSRLAEEVEEGIGEDKRLHAAGCPGCLSYVLVARGNPRCPRCNSNVPFPATKKARIELNLFGTTSSASASVSEIS